MPLSIPRISRALSRKALKQAQRAANKNQDFPTALKKLDLSIRHALKAEGSTLETTTSLNISSLLDKKKMVLKRLEQLEAFRPNSPSHSKKLAAAKQLSDDVFNRIRNAQETKKTPYDIANAKVQELLAKADSRMKRLYK